ncbi:MAG: hypothetical protein MJ252_06985 [archaeon]|nr:hypothetical protein [archaeon]
MKRCDSSCDHSNTKPTLNGLYLFCSICGILTPVDKNKNPSLTKPLKYNNKTETDPLIYLNKLRNETSFKRNELSKVSEIYLKERKGCITFLRNFCGHCNFKSNTFFFAVKLLDTIMLKYTPKDKRDIYLVTLISIIISNKYSSDKYTPISISSLKLNKSLYDYSEEEITQKELEIIKCLNYKVNFQNIFEVLSMMLNCGIVFKTEEEDPKNKGVTENVYGFCFKILMKILESQIFYLFDEYIISFSIIFIARRQYNLSKDNLKILKDIFCLQFKAYRDCAQEIIG